MEAPIEFLLPTGLFAASGMPNFADILSRDEADDIHRHLIAEQHRIKAGESDETRTDVQPE